MWTPEGQAIISLHKARCCQRVHQLRHIVYVRLGSEEMIHACIIKTDNCYTA